MAYLLATHPETFKIITENNINLFHGTRFDALPDILNYGMNSVDELSKKGLVASNGEKWSRTNGKRDFISFTDDLDTALGYASIQTMQDNKKSNDFGILIGISSDDIEQMKTCRVDSEISEIGIMNNVPLEYVKFIAVPKSKVEFVRKLVNNPQITVAPIDMNEKFYYIDDLDFINYDLTKIEELMKEKEHPETTTFNSESVKKLAKGRRKSKMLDIYRKIKDKIKNRGKNIIDDSRDK